MFMGRKSQLNHFWTALRNYGNWREMLKQCFILLNLNIFIFHLFSIMEDLKKQAQLRSPLSMAIFILLIKLLGHYPIVG